MLLRLMPVQLAKLSWKEARSLFTVMQVVTQHQTSPGQKMVATQCCIKERSTALLTYRDRLLEITHVQLGMEWVNRKMLLLQLRCIVSVYSRSTMKVIKVEHLKVHHHMKVATLLLQYISLLARTKVVTIICNRSQKQ